MIWDLVRTEWDWYEGEGLRALTRIGTPGVVQIARHGYAQAPWSGRLHAVSLFKAIRSDESAAAIEEALGVEDDDDLRSYLGAAAAGHIDDRLVPLAPCAEQISGRPQCGLPVRQRQEVQALLPA